MIFYFSGTGNTRHLVSQLASRLADNTVFVPDALADGNTSFRLAPGESIGFAFPTHSWGMPPVVEAFIARMQILGYNSGTYCYMVTSCGDDIGLTAQSFSHLLAKRGITCNAAFSIAMPNTYICLPGFDVDTSPVEQHKITDADNLLKNIALSIAQRRHTTQVTTGNFKWVKSKIIRPLFLALAINDRRFHTIPDRCTHCGACVKACPMHNITMQPHDGTPQWHGNCTMCLNCLHRCPTQALQYGSTTLRKGRYFFGHPTTKSHE